MPVTVKNVNGAAGNASQCPNCGRWLEHWRNCGVFPLPSRCSVSGCPNPVDAGAHVEVADGEGREYIIPMCSFHSGMNGVKLEVEPFRPILASARETCGMDR